MKWDKKNRAGSQVRTQRLGLSIKLQGTLPYALLVTFYCTENRDILQLLIQDLPDIAILTVHIQEVWLLNNETARRF
jgi:hypothetical protein